VRPSLELLIFDVSSMLPAMRHPIRLRLTLGLIGLACVAACSADDRDAILSSGTKLYSQHNEELIIRHFFDDRRDGFFLDVGAFHWKKYSTTYYLEKHLGWSGIAVDALERFAPGYAKNRPGTRFFHHIVTDHSGTMETLYVAGPVSSTTKGHAAEVVRSYGKDDEKADEFEEKGLPQELVPTITLNDLLDQNGVSNIDFLSMDIEQGEPSALAGFDIDRFKPELVCIEVTQSVRDQIVDYFERHDYERIDKYLAYDKVNWYYTPR
jgi:FkbM family methyltransferase